MLDQQERIAKRITAARDWLTKTAANWAGNVPIDDPAYRRGVAFLVHTQRTDGPWLLNSRNKPF